MSELGAALRQFADRVDRGDEFPGATQCALVLADEAGKVQATYMGRFVPAKTAGICLLSAGIQKLATGTQGAST